MAAREQAAAEAARQDAAHQQAAAKAEADRMRLAAQQAESEKSATSRTPAPAVEPDSRNPESARGLIVNINDVLFDFNSTR